MFRRRVFSFLLIVSSENLKSRLAALRASE
jgi:hypothetical protein